MTLIGITKKPKSNQLSSENFEGLPLPILFGNLSISLSFEGFPSGSLTIENISEEEIEKYRKVYSKVGTKLLLFDNIYLEVGSYSETEDLMSVVADETFRSYTIAVNLRSGNEVRSNASVEVKSAGTKDQFGSNLNLTVNGNLNTAAVANASKLSYSGYNYSKKIPEKSASFRTNFQSLVSEKLREKRRILDWTDKTIKTPNYRSGATWEITTQDIMYSVDVASQVPSQYRNTVITGKDNLPFTKDSRKKSLKEIFDPKTKRKPPVKLVTTEGDLKPLIPPVDVRKLRTIDMNFDFSGPRKTLKRTTTLNGQPYLEELFTYGFVYLAQDIRNVDAENETKDIYIPALKSDSPEDWWKLIEYQKTEYVYKTADVTASVVGKDTSGKTYRGEVIGSSVFETTYLTEVITKGWKLTRFQQEQFDEFGTNNDSLDSRWLNDEIAFLSNKKEAGGLTPDEGLDLAYAKEKLKSITFTKTPFRSTTQYYLVPADNIYSNVEQAPFQTQFVDKVEIGAKGEGKVLVAIPDTSYIFPMKVLEERTLVQSFNQMDHPENIYIRDDRRKTIEDNSLTEEEKRENLRDLKLLPWLTTGEDTYRCVLRKVLPSKNTTNKDEKRQTDIYLEYQSNASHNDHNFQYSLQEKTFSTVVGQLPDATVFSFEYESKDDNEDKKKKDDDKNNFEYRISTTTNIEDPVLTESINYEVDTLTEALAIAKCELELDNFMSSTDINMNLAWFYPKIRPGDYIKILDDLDKKDLRVKNISFNINYQGIVSGELIKTCEGTSITCGVMPNRNINVRKVRKDTTLDDALDIKTSITGKPIFGTTVIPKIKTRRNPSALDVEEETGRFI